MREEIGFSSEKERSFLNRLDESRRRENLAQELTTQLEEDFGLIQFTLEYQLDDEGRIRDIKSGQGMVELTTRGGRNEEVESIRQIEQGLKADFSSTWISFSPKNDRYGYPNNCVDFWRVVEDGRVVWNRIVVKNDFESMNRLRSFLSGEPKVKDEFEILASPIKSSGLKLTELFDLFSLSEVKNGCSLELIERVIEDYIDEFEGEFDKKVTDDPEIILRLYSACYKAIRNNQIDEGLLDRRQLELYMFGRMNRVIEKESSGCAAATRVGEFGEKIGYYVTADGQVKYGEIPDEFKECKKCGCWYKGGKCPFC